MTILKYAVLVNHGYVAVEYEARQLASDGPVRPVADALVNVNDVNEYNSLGVGYPLMLPVVRKDPVVMIAI